MKKIILIFFCLTLTATIAWSQFVENYDYHPLMGSIQKTIEQAVGTTDADRIPGGFSYSGPTGGFNYSGPVFKAEGIECPQSILDVKQAADLIQARLSLDFTNRVVNISRQSFSPGNDTTTLEAGLRDAKVTNKVMSLKIIIFKRSSSRVILFPVYFANPHAGGGG